MDIPSDSGSGGARSCVQSGKRVRRKSPHLSGKAVFPCSVGIGLLWASCRLVMAHTVSGVASASRLFQYSCLALRISDFHSLRRLLAASWFLPQRSYIYLRSHWSSLRRNIDRRGVHHGAHFARRGLSGTARSTALFTKLMMAVAALAACSAV